MKTKKNQIIKKPATGTGFINISYKDPSWRASYFQTRAGTIKLSKSMESGAAPGLYLGYHMGIYTTTRKDSRGRGGIIKYRYGEREYIWVG